MTSPSIFWDRIAARYAKAPIADEAAYRQKLAITRGYLRPEMDVLEFGCGTGSTALLHAPHVKHILATDISARMIAIAREKAAAQQVKNVTFEQTDLDALDGQGRAFDAVLGLNILHLVPDRDAAIRKVHGLLKPGGAFITSTACLNDTALWPLKFVAPLGRLLTLLPLVRFFSVQELERSLTAAGFRIDHRWLPGRNKALFIVATKAAA